MPDGRQVAANRRNARKSTGPRSPAGKKRAAGNALRHGLCRSSSSLPEFARYLDKRARKIAGESRDMRVLEQARDVATAEFDLSRVRRLKLALIDRMSGLSGSAAFDGGDPYSPDAVGGSVDPTNSISSQPETIRRILAELLKLSRYEHRAAARRNKAFHKLRLYTTRYG
jgi:hypothetical protein